MTTFNRILVPLDGSKRAESALSWVQILPARHLRLIRVCPEANDARAEAATYLEEVASQMAPSGATIDIQVIDDGPAEGIVSAAADADLVVMCTHGAGDGGRLLFGSVADRVARHAPVPTMLVRGGREPIAAALVRRIVVPLDGSPAAERALPMA
ncbi:MAG: universal stress protein, partial [Chloroflexia bacterium]|nr:universal stress protein [Chloroflexia bacterium]